MLKGNPGVDGRAKAKGTPCMKLQHRGLLAAPYGWVVYTPVVVVVVGGAFLVVLIWCGLTREQMDHVGRPTCGKTRVTPPTDFPPPPPPTRLPMPKLVRPH